MITASGPQPYNASATSAQRFAGGQPRPANNLQFGLIPPDLGVCSIPCACAGCLIPIGIIAGAMLFAKKAISGVMGMFKKLTGLAAQAAGELKKAAQQG